MPTGRLAFSFDLEALDRPSPDGGKHRTCPARSCTSRARHRTPLRRESPKTVTRPNPSSKRTPFDATHSRAHQSCGESTSSNRLLASAPRRKKPYLLSRKQRCGRNKRQLGVGHTSGCFSGALCFRDAVAHSRAMASGDYLAAENAKPYGFVIREQPISYRSSLEPTRQTLAGGRRGPGG